MVGHASALKKRASGLFRLEFTVFWLLVMALHTLCAVYLLAMAKLYFFVELPTMSYFADLLAFPEERHFQLFGVCVGVLGASHAVQLILHLVWSFHTRSLVVWPWTAIGKQLTKFSGRLAKPHRNSILQTPATVLNVLGFEGDRFELMFLLRKAVEVAAQIVQCYRYSTLISSAWINHAFVAMVVTNCVVTPLLNHVMLVSSSRAQARVASSSNVNARIPSVRGRTLCVSVDVLLTAISSLVLPLAIFAPWVLNFDTLQWAFPDEVLYSDITFTRLVYENKAIFAAWKPFALCSSATLQLPRHLSLSLGLELWNVTIVHWGREAALSGAIHRKMIFLVMVFVNMTTLPEGIHTPPVPKVLVDIEIIASNLTRIPDEVADAWRNAQIIYLEHTLLDEFPTVLFRLPVDEISLVNNSLKDLPDDLFTLGVYRNQFSILALSYNPLQKLPDSAASSLFVGELLMAHTQVDTLPVWVETSVKELVQLGNSPFCEEEDAEVLETIDCTESERKPLDSGLYPLAFVELSRQI